MLTKSSELQPVIKFVNAWSKTPIYQKNHPATSSHLCSSMSCICRTGSVGQAADAPQNREQMEHCDFQTRCRTHCWTHLWDAQMTDHYVITLGDVLQSGGFSVHALVLIVFPAAAGFSHLIWSYPDRLQTTEFIRFLSFYFTFKKQH